MTGGSAGDEEPVGDAGFDEWLEALAAGEGYALECPEGHRSLPPRRVCPRCGDDRLERVAIGDRGTVEARSVVHVPTPGFAEDAPYVLAIADVDGVRLTGQVVAASEAEAEAEADRAVPAAGKDAKGNEPATAEVDVEIGDPVGIGVGTRRTTGEPLIVFTPR